METEKAVIEGQVTQEVIRQRNLSAELYEAVDQLALRLGGVTRDDEPTPEAVTEDKTPLVSLAQQIAENNGGVVNCINILTSLLNRNEI